MMCGMFLQEQEEREKGTIEENVNSMDECECTEFKTCDKCLYDMFMFDEASQGLWGYLNR